MEVPDKASSVGERVVGPGRGNGGTSGRSNCPANSRLQQKIPESFFYDGHGNTFISTLYQVTLCDGPIAAWRALRNHFEHDTLVKFKKQYFHMEIKECSCVQQNIKTMKELTDRLAAINAPISEEDQIVMLLGSLTSSYSTLVTAARDAITL